MRAVFLVGLVLFVAVGCGGARYIHKDPNGGVVAMRDASSASREKALKLIEEHVGPGYTIVEEREVVTGQETTNNANTQNELTAHSQVPFLPAQRQTTVTTTTTRDLTEFQIVYRRANAPAAPSLVQQAGAEKPATPTRTSGVQPAAGTQPVGVK